MTRTGILAGRSRPLRRFGRPAKPVDQAGAQFPGHGLVAVDPGGGEPRRGGGGPRVQGRSARFGGSRKEERPVGRRPSKG